jgi:hypothetical protein
MIPRRPSPWTNCVKPEDPARRTARGLDPGRRRRLRLRRSGRNLRLRRRHGEEPRQPRAPGACKPRWKRAVTGATARRRATPCARSWARPTGWPAPGAEPAVTHGTTRRRLRGRVSVGLGNGSVSGHPLSTRRGHGPGPAADLRPQPDPDPGGLQPTGGGPQDRSATGRRTQRLRAPRPSWTAPRCCCARSAPMRSAPIAPRA